MIPVHLSISGFLSYRDPVELDFTELELACIAGPNGAGKSSLLDAMTWALFGQARRRDDSIINVQSDAADVSLIFSYENNLFRVQRVKPRDKTAMLEFHIQQENDGSAVWRPLTERSLRETELRVQQTLRLDYETFVNASFFLQGKADQFTQQRPGDRKRILGSVLGLEVWEVYRQRAVERRKVLEVEITGLDGRLHEIASELAEEEARRERLKGLEEDLERIRQERMAQEQIVENIRRIAATLADQAKLVDTLQRQMDSAGKRLNELERRAEGRRQERKSYAEQIEHAEEIRAAYAAWTAARQELSRWEEVSARFREQEKRREGPRDEINAARARLTQESQTLQKQAQEIEKARAEIADLAVRIETVCSAQAETEAKLAQRAELNLSLQAALKAQADAAAENGQLRPQMEELKERIDRLKAAEGAECPLCGQPLSPQERLNLIEKLEAQGKELGTRYRLNQTTSREADGRVRELEAQIAALSKAEKELQTHTQALAQLTGRRELLESQQTAWQTGGGLRLAEAAAELQHETFAPEARQRLAEIDAELKAIGYDAAAHDAVKRAEQDGRESEGRLRLLENAQAALMPIERELSDLEAQIETQQVEVRRQRDEHTEAAAALAAAQAQAPDLEMAEQTLYQLQEKENFLRLEVGAAKQKVLVLKDLKARRKGLDEQREELSKKVGQYKQLERAFSKDGVPALLIEQALPQIEAKSNEVLERLSGGTMSVRFVTQAAYKDKKRDDLKETLDIQISDSAGVRDYENYSGGEQFRVNFAIRLALSEVLAQRSGARLQTLVIDEGFGSQDTQGRQRLIEAINLVRNDFAKILVITHIDELKDAFPSRIEVEKLDGGSQVRLV